MFTFPFFKPIRLFSLRLPRSSDRPDMVAFFPPQSCSELLTPTQKNVGNIWLDYHIFLAFLKIIVHIFSVDYFLDRSMRLVFQTSTPSAFVPYPVSLLAPMSFVLPPTFNQRSAPSLSGRKAGEKKKKMWSWICYCQFWTSAHAFSYVDFGGKMLARSLKNIWTDEKLVYLCSAKDKMVSNPATVLQTFFTKCPKTILRSQTANSTVPAADGVATPPCVLFLKRVCTSDGAPWVGSNLEKRSCPTGYRPSYLVLEGGSGVGRSNRESQAPLLCRSAPRALAGDWWSVRAQSCLPDR